MLSPNWGKDKMKFDSLSPDYARVDDESHSVSYSDSCLQEHEPVSSNMAQSMQDLLSALQFLPDSTTPKKNRNSTSIPLVEGFLGMQTPSTLLAEAQWSEVWVEVVGNTLYWRKRREDSSNLGAVRIAYALAEDVKFEDGDDEDDQISLGISKKKAIEYNDMFKAYLEQEQAENMFKVCTPNRIIIFRCKDADQKEEFYRAIASYLRPFLGESLWKEKVLAAEALEPMLREQFMIQMQRHERILSVLENSGLMGSSSMLSSEFKEKLGVLDMFQQDDEDDVGKWKAFYFIIQDGVLYWFKDSKSTRPSSFLTLRYATVELDVSGIQNNLWIFNVRTPLRTLRLKAKHAVALAEWVSAIERVMVRDNKPKSRHRKKSSLFRMLDVNSEAHEKLLQETQVEEEEHRKRFKAILDQAYRVRTSRIGLMDMLASQEGRNLFVKFLDQTNRIHVFKCLVAFKSYRALAANSEDLKPAAKDIFDKYVQKGSEYQLSGIEDDVFQEIESKLSMEKVPADTFEPLWKCVLNQLLMYYGELNKTAEFKEFTAQLHTSYTTTEQKDFENNSETMVPTLEITLQKGKKKLVHLDPARTSVTLGRDISTDIAIDDSRVSRSHARVEYTKTHCEYFDLGSTGGSLLNGTRIEHAVLVPGDEIRMGTTKIKLILAEPKKKFGDYILHGMKSLASKGGQRTSSPDGVAHQGASNVTPRSNSVFSSFKNLKRNSITS